MKHKSQSRSVSFGQPSAALAALIAVTLFAVALMITAQGASAEHADWEFKVVILKGVTAGGTIEKDADGTYVDMKKTRALNTLAAEGWIVVAVTGGVATDHTVYLRRTTNAQ